MILNQWYLFTKVNVRVSGVDDPACKMHVNSNNYGYCCILILSLGHDLSSSGGEQLKQQGSNVFKLKCTHGDIFIGEYQNIIHDVLPVTTRTRCAVIAYTSNKILSIVG